MKSAFFNPLGLIRVVAVTYFALFAINGRFGTLKYYQGIPQDLLTQNWFFRFTHLSFPPDLSQPSVLGIAPLWLFAISYLIFAVTSAIGYRTRISLFVFALLSLYFNSGFTSVVFFDHEAVLTQYLLFLLVLLPGSESLSADSFLSVFRRTKLPKVSDRIKRALVHPDFHRFNYDAESSKKIVLLVFALVYLVAGVSKLALSDGKWWDGNTLGYYLGRETAEILWIGSDRSHEPTEPGKPPIAFVDHTYGGSTTQLGKLLSQSQALLIVLSITTLAWDFTGFCFFLSRPSRNVYILICVSLHFGIGLTMGLGFPTYRMYLLLLLDWPWIFDLIKRIRTK